MRRPPPALPLSKQRRGVSKSLVTLFALIGVVGLVSMATHSQRHNVLPTNSFRPHATAAKDAAVPDVADAPPAFEYRLLSRATPAWAELQAEGLFHPNSGYPRILPPGDKEKTEWAQWQERVRTEWPGGARRRGAALPGRAAGLGRPTHAACSRPLLLALFLRRLQARVRRECHQEAVFAEAAHHWAGARLCSRTARPAPL